MRFDGKPGKWWCTPAAYDHRYDFHRAHFDAYLEALDRQITAVREGRLSTTWRDDLITSTRTNARRDRNPLFSLLPTARPAPPQVALSVHEILSGPITHGCLMELPADVLSAQVEAGRAAGLNLLAICAQLDVAAIPAADWEPYATGGDWDAALRAWYRALCGVLAYRRQRVRPMVAAANHQIDCDLAELSYRAGVAAGIGRHDDSWDWLAERTYSWLDHSAAANYRLALLDFDSSTGRAAATPPPPAPDPYRGTWLITSDRRASAHPLPLIPAHPLPAYWTEPAPVDASHNGGVTSDGQNTPE